MPDNTEKISEILKRRTHKKMKVTNSKGVYDCYKWLRKNKWPGVGKPINEHLFYAVVRKMNKLAAESIALGNSFVFPYRMGAIDIKRVSTGSFFKNGKLKVIYPVNWKETLDLWLKDAEAKANKILVRMEPNTLFKIQYSKTNASYRNNIYYDFQVNRFLKIALKENINKDKVDTLW